ncbi:MAG TPA: hypothetical protein VNU68_16555 [Verrucomicrobiae bacterium]|jgi:hypothetical protein|nr:hypothetical protein [Verrucomicrobiae bacterium]
MKTNVLTVLVLLGMAAWRNADAEEPEHRFGAGLIVGEPTGASLKYFFNDKFAVDGLLGQSFQHDNDFYIHSDVLYHIDLFKLDEGRLPIFFGVGLRGRFDDGREDSAGVRVPVGVSYMFDRIPVDVFFEVAPIFDFTPKSRTDYSVGVGARYWF